MIIPIEFHIIGLAFAFIVGYLVREWAGNAEPKVNAPKPLISYQTHGFFWGPESGKHSIMPSPAELTPSQMKKVKPIQSRKPLLRTRGAKLGF